MNEKLKIQFGVQACAKCKYYLRCEECVNNKIGIEIVVEARKEAAKAFAQKLKFNLLNNSVIDDDCTLEDFEFGGDEIQEALNDTLKQFGVEVEE